MGLDNSDQTGAYGHYCRLGISLSPARVEIGNSNRIPGNANCKDLRKLLDVKRANRYREELEDTMGVFPLLRTDAL
jgi:hypothetical protein